MPGCPSEPGGFQCDSMTTTAFRMVCGASICATIEVRIVTESSVRAGGKAVLADPGDGLR